MELWRGNSAKESRVETHGFNSFNRVFNKSSSWLSCVYSKGDMLICIRQQVCFFQSKFSLKLPKNVNKCLLKTCWVNNLLSKRFQRLRKNITVMLNDLNPIVILGIMRCRDHHASLPVNLGLQSHQDSASKAYLVKVVSKGPESSSAILKNHSLSIRVFYRIWEELLVKVN